MKLFSLVSCLAAFVAAAAQAGSLSYEDLEKILQDPARQVRSIDQLLAQPEFKPSYLKNFTMMFASRSLQAASPLNPRVILYGEDAKLIMTFNCAEGDCQRDSAAKLPKSSASLEIQAWRDDTKSFEFHRIEFPEAGPGSVKISPANPELCMGCHMGPADPRPNWDSYPLWTGAYGGDDDHLAGHLAEGETRENLQQFLAGASTRPRYRRLVELAEGYDNRGTRDRKEHNIDFSQRVHDLNVARMVNRIRRSPYYEDLKFALADVLGGGNSFDGQLRDANLDALAEATGKCVHPAFDPSHIPMFRSRTSEVARLFDGLGESTLPWFLRFDPSLSDEMISGNNVDTSFWLELRREDPSIDEGYMTISERVREGWQRLATRPGLQSGLERCFADLENKPSLK